jgi:hypothetical protein
MSGQVCTPSSPILTAAMSESEVSANPTAASAGVKSVPPSPNEIAERAAAEQTAQENASDAANLLTVNNLGRVPGVWGIGVGNDKNGNPQIEVTVTKITPEITAAFPPSENGFPVVIMVDPQPSFPKEWQ